ncbi:heterokaryon incompatibility, partial [Clohesyomyces aquaticus]
AEKDAPITSTFHPARLDDEPVYTTLSYAWGDNSTPEYIFVNGTAFSVTPNQASALLHLRPTEGFLTMWIDAICIEQANEAEKSHQIRLMGSIYENATRIIAWPGPPTDDSDYAM